MSSATHREAITKVFVGGISQETDDNHLREYFSRFGKVHTASVMTDKLTGNSRGFGFVIFDSADAVEQLCSMFLDLFPYKYIYLLVYLSSYGQEMLYA